jgi:hypothetical protein
MRLSNLINLVLIAASASAFVVVPQQQRRVQLRGHVSEIEEMCLGRYHLFFEGVSDCFRSSRRPDDFGEVFASCLLKGSL